MQTKINYSFKEYSKTYKEELNLKNVPLKSKLEENVLNNLKSYSNFITFLKTEKNIDLNPQTLEVILRGGQNRTGVPHTSFVDKNSVKKIRFKRKNKTYYKRLSTRFLDADSSQINLVLKHIE